MKLLAKVTVLALLLAGCLVSMPVTVSATGPSCYGSSCDGRDPAKTSCVHDARTLMSRHAHRTSPPRTADIGILELRYSPSCHSNWVRFTPWTGSTAWVRDLISHASYDGLPWIWRQGVPNSLRGKVGHSSYFGRVVTTWTEMVTADGVTCSSVSLYSTADSTSGQGARDRLGEYNAPCIS